MSAKKNYLPSKLIPSCDFCGATAKYDAPTLAGPWANMCSSCAAIKTSINQLSIGTEFVEQDQTMQDQGKDKPAVRVYSNISTAEDDELASIIMDSVATVTCPTCGAPRDIEHDCVGTIQCHCCQQKMIVDPFDDLCREI